jgi:hypothetical protein
VAQVVGPKFNPQDQKKKKKNWYQGARSVVQVTQHLPSRLEALVQSLALQKNKKEKKKERRKKEGRKEELAST